MRRLFFAGDDADFNFLEPDFFQPALQVALRKTQPAVAIEFASPLEIVLEQLKNQNLTARTKDSVRGIHSASRLFSMASWARW